MIKLKKYAFSDLYDMSSGISTTKEQSGHGSPFVSFSTVFNNYFLPENLPDLMDTSAKEQELFSAKIAIATCNNLQKVKISQYNLKKQAVNSKSFLRGAERRTGKTCCGAPQCRA